MRSGQPRRRRLAAALTAPAGCPPGPSSRPSLRRSSSRRSLQGDGPTQPRFPAGPLGLCR
eukprot:6862321-Pyramimonas_sp.AAC.1